MSTTNTLIRYPGGKSRLTNYISKLISLNEIGDGYYVEPYAGGAGLAINLLLKGFVRYVHLNDIDLSIFSVWHSVINEPEKLCKFINDVNVSLDEWNKQKEVFLNKEDHDLLTLGKAALFLNRTNRSGILNGGVIGGFGQNGNYKIDARFNKETLIKKIEKIAFYKSRIKIFNQDASHFLNDHVAFLPEKTLINLDPPYYKKGKKLYQNFYNHSDHEEISKIISSLQQFWIVTYDNVPQIRSLYSDYSILEFGLSYSAQKKYRGKEIIIIDPRLRAPPQKLLKAVC